MDFGAFEVGFFCGNCHSGGGMMEYGRDGIRYDDPAYFSGPLATPMDTFLGAVATEAGMFSGDGMNGTGTMSRMMAQGDFFFLFPNFGVAPAPWQWTGVGEVDCLQCHLDTYSMDARNRMILPVPDLTAMPSQGAGLITGYSRMQIPDCDPIMPGAQPCGNYGGAATATVWYDPAKVEAGTGKLLSSVIADIYKTPAKENCQVCHGFDGSMAPKMYNIGGFFGGYDVADPLGCGTNWNSAIGVAMSNCGEFGFTTPSGQWNTGRDAMDTSSGSCDSRFNMGGSACGGMTYGTTGNPTQFGPQYDADLCTTSYNKNSQGQSIFDPVTCPDATGMMSGWGMGGWTPGFSAPIYRADMIKRIMSSNDVYNPDIHMDNAGLTVNTYITGADLYGLPVYGPATIAAGNGMDCATCHINYSGTIPERSYTANSQTITLPAATYSAIDHQFIKGNGLENARNNVDDTLSCASCHAAGATHPNKGTAQNPAARHTEVGITAIHIQKIACQTCHAPEQMSRPDVFFGRLDIADFSVGNRFGFPRYLTDGMLTSGNMANLISKPSYMWRPETFGGSDLKIFPINFYANLRWVDGSSSNPIGLNYAGTAADMVQDLNPGFGWKLNSMDPKQALMMNTTAEITAMRSTLTSILTGAGFSSPNPKVDIAIGFFTTGNHNIASKTSGKILGDPDGGGCLMCHSSSNPSSPYYSSSSVGFFDKTIELLPIARFGDTANAPATFVGMLGWTNSPTVTEGIQQTEVSGSKIVSFSKTFSTPSGSVAVDLAGSKSSGQAVDRTVNQGTILGYDSATMEELTSCTTCHGTKALTMAMGDINCIDCHTAHDTASANASCLTCHTAPATNGGGVVLDSTQAAQYADNIHNSTPIARFSWSNDTTTSYKINFSAAGTTCPTGYTCTYSWDFTNDGSTDATGITTSNTYAGTGPYTAKLTVAATNGQSDDETHSVTPTAVNAAPTCGTNTVSYDAGNRKIVTFTQSGAAGLDGSEVLYINWGDGSPLTATTPNSATTHTYGLARQYTLKYMVKDSGGQSCKGSVAVDTRAATCTVTVDTDANLANATVYVKTLGGSTRCFGLTDASGNKVCSGLAPNSYKVYIYKTGVTFDGDGAGTDNMPVTVTCSGTPSAASVTFTHTP